MLRVLLIASIISLAIGLLKDGIKTGWIEGTAIFFAVFLVVSISSYMNYQETEQFLKLSRETKLKKVLVIRDGREKEISIESLQDYQCNRFNESDYEWKDIDNILNHLNKK